MHSDKKLTKEDTWRPAELKRYLREKDNGDGYSRRKEDNERKHRGGESVERRHRDPDESRRDRDELKERERRHGDSRERRHGDSRERRHGDSRERRQGDSRDRHPERRKDGSRDTRGDKDRERRDDEDRRKQIVDGRDIKDRHKHKEKDELKVREEVRDKRREERETERRREGLEREHRRERRRHDERSEIGRGQTEKLYRELRDRQHRGEYEDKRRDKDVQEERRRSEQTEDGVRKEDHRRRKEEGERRHKERRHHDEKRKHGSESKERQDLKKPDGDVRSYHDDRDQMLRDKHKEKHKKEEDSADGRHKDRRHKEAEEEDVEKSSSKKSSSDKRKEEKKDEKEQQQTADRQQGEDHIENADPAEQAYEEDFEDYEEDFEDVDENADEGEDDEEEEGQTAEQRKETEAIRRAMAEENERVGTAQSRSSTAREEEQNWPKWSKGSERDESKTSRHGKFINFVAAKQREISKKVATKQKKRSTELLRLIDLDFSMTFSLLDIPPVSEYEMYIKSFGNANTKQAYVQCNEDNADRSIQTEEVEICEKWTQHPPEYNRACGDPNFSHDAQDKSRIDLLLDSQCLMSFLRSASQVMVVLLEEDQAEKKSLRKLKTQTDSLSFTDGSLQLNTKFPFLLGRQISLVQFSEVQKHIMLSVHMPSSKASTINLDSCTIICVWNIWEPSTPQKILIYESEVQCCCFSPGKSTLVFAGTLVGSVVLWDLREFASNHYRLKIGDYEWTFRHPTFSTDAVMSGSGHVSPVTSIEVVPSFVAGGPRPEVPLLASEEESSGLSFQLASLDESGILNFWVVVELPKGNEAGSPTDLGLRPGGRVKLLHSSSLLTVPRPSLKEAAKTRPFQTLLLKYHPTDSNHFFIGTNLGLVRHGTSHGLKAPPQFYKSQEVEERTVDINSIHFSPFRPNLFLVGCADGSIRMHAVSHNQPVAEWMTSTSGEAVISLQWTQTRPAVFCVLDAASNLHIWDMLKDDGQPVMTETFRADRVTAMAVFGDSGQQNTYSGIVLAHESGNIELQYFTQSLTLPNPAEEGKLESLMTGLLKPSTLTLY
ncbi:cytoplasmic dynein 2 intermediate chain 1 isoform X2 [Gambusia affinis]|uniref:cytoplasmic dynein 2 intermediate chain 1 isoform X2 n=1 Tax=Gambusia affinis TaxID=33528 RepID=UPI001CDCA26F|nr:cytoplasmic dynein 2 intermediate chain 1 isoform X2 [Gambusia affinis]